MVSQSKSAKEIAEIMAGMRPAPTSPGGNKQDNPKLVAQRKRIREKQYRIENKQLEEGEIEIGEFDSNWSTGSRARKNDNKRGNY